MRIGGRISSAATPHILFFKTVSMGTLRIPRLHFFITNARLPYSEIYESTILITYYTV
jgi:hypothetical protein